MKTKNVARMKRFYSLRYNIGQHGNVLIAKYGIMKKVFLLSFALTILFVGVTSANAASYYVRSGASGSNNGSDWINAYTALPSTLVRGSTYYIAGGSYGAYTLNAPQSGTQYITIKKAISSDHGTDIGWQSSYGNTQATFYGFVIRTSFWIIDGSTRNESSWKDSSAYGIKIDSQKGNQEGVLVPYNDPLLSVSNITLKYIYFHGGGPDGASRDQDSIMFWSNGFGLTVQRSYFYNSGRDHVHTIGMDDGLFEYNYFYLNESTPEQHSESFALKYGSDNWILRFNVWDTCEGTAFIVSAGSTNTEVYGNVFMDSEWMGNGIISGWSHTTMGTGKFYNNTIANVQNPGIGWYSSGISTYNNLFYGWTDNPTFTGAHNYNAFQGSNAFGEGNAQTGITSTKFVNYTNRNLRLSSATTAGTALSSPYNIDMDGKSRGSDGIWDRGAFEFVSGNPKTPSPPTIIQITP